MSKNTYCFDCCLELVGIAEGWQWCHVTDYLLNTVKLMSGRCENEHKCWFADCFAYEKKHYTGLVGKK